MVSDGGDDGAVDGSEDLFEGIRVDLAETHVDNGFIAGEMKLKALLEAFETRIRH